jgi:membrane-associated phospholipid phosphatase
VTDAVRVWGATAAFLVGWTTVYGAASWASGFVPWSVHVALPVEPVGPLVPAAAVVYVSMGALLTLVPLVLRTWDAVRPVFAALVVETALAAACFVALPVAKEPWLDPPPTNLAMAWADAMNLERNYLPSLHVTYAVTAALALGRRSPRWGVVGGAWAVAIAASTLLLRYHYVLDVVTGVALAWVTHRSCHPHRAPPTTPPPARGPLA